MASEQNPHSATAEGHDDARAALLSLLDSGEPVALVDRDPWKRENMPDQLPRQAAVLILFGQLDRDGGAESAQVGAPRVPVEEVDVLLLVRASTLRQHAGEPAFPGGKVDPEDLRSADPCVEAALREAEEETGLDRSGVEILGTLAPIPLPVTNFMVTPVLAWWTRPSRVGVVDQAESAHVFRIPVRDLTEPDHRHLATVTRGRTTHRTPAFTVPTEAGPITVWGFTGILLDRLLHRLGWERPWDQSRTAPAPGH